MKRVMMRGLFERGRSRIQAGSYDLRADRSSSQKAGFRVSV